MNLISRFQKILYIIYNRIFNSAFFYGLSYIVRDDFLLINSKKFLIQLCFI